VVVYACRLWLWNEKKSDVGFLLWSMHVGCAEGEFCLILPILSCFANWFLVIERVGGN
jgi:hypothetical protein